MWINNINGKKYIGRHCGNKSNSYIGSGKYFRRAWRKYGKKNFNRTILKHCKSIDECIEWEQYYLDLYDVSNNKEFYNISPSAHGGHHGADYNGHKNPMWGKKHPNHVPHHGKENGMYGVRRILGENPNAKKTCLIDPNGNKHEGDSLKGLCIKLFGDDKLCGKLKHLIYKCKENKSLRSDAQFYGWKGYYID